jgi:hypothetical protein
VTRSGEPAVLGANVSLGSADTDLGGEERANRWAGRRFRGEEVKALPAAPLLVTCHSRKHCFLHLLRRTAGVQDVPGMCKDARVMHFFWLRGLVDVFHRINSSSKGLDKSLSKTMTAYNYLSRYHRKA